MDFGRLIVAMVTPYKSDLEVDYDKVKLLAARLEGQGVTALVVSGTTGESPTLTREEKIKLIKTVKATVKIPVIANVGTNDTKVSTSNALDASIAGADGVLVVAPYYNKPDQDMLYDHFAAIARAVNLPVMLYNVPGRTGVNIQAETVIRLSRDVPNIVSIKDASGNLDAMTNILNGAAPGFLVYTGEDSMTLPSLAIGAYGVVSVAAHVTAVQMAAMVAAHLSGKHDEAARLHGLLCDINRILFLQPNPVPVKKALALCGFDAGGLRPPLKEASADITRQLKDALAVLGLA